MHIETFVGCIHTELDVAMLIDLCKNSILPRVKRRLHEDEKKLIQCGSIFVYEEQESNMKRWTDSRLWSPSRTSGMFIAYREYKPQAIELYKKTITAKLMDKNYHIICYTSLDDEITARCCLKYGNRLKRVYSEFGSNKNVPQNNSTLENDLRSKILQEDANRKLIDTMKLSINSQDNFSPKVANVKANLNRKEKKSNYLDSSNTVNVINNNGFKKIVKSKSIDEKDLFQLQNNPNYEVVNENKIYDLNKRYQQYNHYLEGNVYSEYSENQKKEQYNALNDNRLNNFTAYPSNETRDQYYNLNKNEINESYNIEEIRDQYFDFNENRPKEPHVTEEIKNQYFYDANINKTNGLMENIDNESLCQYYNLNYNRPNGTFTNHENLNHYNNLNENQTNGLEGYAGAEYRNHYHEYNVNRTDGLEGYAAQKNTDQYNEFNKNKTDGLGGYGGAEFGNHYDEFNVNITDGLEGYAAQKNTDQYNEFNKNRTDGLGSYAGAEFRNHYNNWNVNQNNGFEEYVAQKNMDQYNEFNGKITDGLGGYVVKEAIDQNNNLNQKMPNGIENQYTNINENILDDFEGNLANQSVEKCFFLNDNSPNEYIGYSNNQNVEQQFNGLYENKLNHSGQNIINKKRELYSDSNMKTVKNIDTNINIEKHLGLFNEKIHEYYVKEDFPSMRNDKKPRESQNFLHKSKIFPNVDFFKIKEKGILKKSRENIEKICNNIYNNEFMDYNILSQINDRPVYNENPYIFSQDYEERPYYNMPFYSKPTKYKEINDSSYNESFLNNLSVQENNLDLNDENTPKRENENPIDILETKSQKNIKLINVFDATKEKKESNYTSKLETILNGNVEKKVNTPKSKKNVKVKSKHKKNKQKNKQKKVLKVSDVSDSSTS